MFSHIVRQWVTLSFFVAACSFFLWKIRQNAKDDVRVCVSAQRKTEFRYLPYSQGMQ